MNKKNIVKEEINLNLDLKFQDRFSVGLENDSTVLSASRGCLLNSKVDSKIVFHPFSGSNLMRFSHTRFITCLNESERIFSIIETHLYKIFTSEPPIYRLFSFLRLESGKRPAAQEILSSGKTRNGFKTLGIFLCPEFLLYRPQITKFRHQRCKNFMKLSLYVKPRTPSYFQDHF